MNLKRILLLLLEEWEKICYYFLLIKSNDVPQEYLDLFGTENVAGDGSGDENDSDEANREVGRCLMLRRY